MKTRITSPLLALAAIVFFQQTIACTDDDDPNDFWTELDCRQYCDRANDCDEDVNPGECEDRCLSALANCQADERDEAQDQLDLCTDVACDELTGCTIDVGAQCFFGL